jgi:hypothetical protein
VKSPDFPSAMRPVPMPPENLTFSDDNSDPDEDRGQQK